MRCRPTILLVLVSAGPSMAADLEWSAVPRVTVAGISGLGMTPAAFQQQVDAVTAGTGSPATSDHDVTIGVAIEAAFLVGMGGQGGRVHLLTGPAGIASWNRNDLSIVSGPVTVEGRETVTAMGGKWYLGVGVRTSERLHLEVLPYAGVAAVRQRMDLRTTDALAATTVGTASDRRGHMTLYGCTVGLFYTAPEPDRSLVGIRVGLACGGGDVDGTDFRQQGGFAALEYGYRL